MVCDHFPDRQGMTYTIILAAFMSLLREFETFPSISGVSRNPLTFETIKRVVIDKNG
jgi:hypothetical protein